MATTCQIQDAINQCVSVVRRYHETERTHRKTSAMTVEVQSITVWVNDLDLGVNEAEDRIVHPLNARLIAQYGHELGSRLGIEFMTAFDTLFVDEHSPLFLESSCGPRFSKSTLSYLGKGEYVGD